MENLTLVKWYPNDRPGIDPNIYRSPSLEGMILEVLESPKHGVSMFETVPQLYRTLYAGPGKRDPCYYKCSRIRILSQISFSLVSTAELGFKQAPEDRAIAPLSSSSGCLGHLRVLLRREGVNKMESNFLSSGREHASAGSSLSRMPFVQNLTSQAYCLPFVTQMLLLHSTWPKLTPSRLDTGECLVFVAAATPCTLLGASLVVGLKHHCTAWHMQFWNAVCHTWREGGQKDSFHLERSTQQYFMWNPD